MTYIRDFGFQIDDNAIEIDEEIAELVEEELGNVTGLHEEEMDTAEIYDEIIHQEKEKSLIKSQRKLTAGKEKIKIKKSKEDNIEIASLEAITIEDFITVKEFSEKTGISAAKIIGELMKNGILANINQQIDYDTISVIALELGVNIKRKRGAAKIEDMMEGNLAKLLHEDDKSVLVSRPAIVSIMGHVDHGKTKLLDTIRDTNVIATEAGGITQHIGAYQVEKNGRKITFLDTPGHEAFTAMRARGAKATDIAILVVAADEGVKPQTIEAINHAKDAGIPIIVAMNKMDKEGANPDKVMIELAEHGLQSEAWGGNTVMVPISALKGEGIDKLLDMILLTADMLDLKANPNRPAVGTVIEAHVDLSLGPVATIVVNSGSLNTMDNVIVGSAYGRIKTMKDFKGKKLKTLYPSDTAQISGLSVTPRSGDILQVVTSEKEARQKAMAISDILKLRNIFSLGMTMSDLIGKIKEGNLKTLKLIIKTDTQGSLEAIKGSLSKMPTNQVNLKVIHSCVGAVSESDVMMAAAGGAIILAFHSEVPGQVERIAEKHNVEILSYKIIYKLIDDVKNLLSGLLEAEIVEVELGRIEILQVFYTKKKEMIIGCKVLSGEIENKSKIRIMRKGEEVGHGEISSLQIVDKKVEKVKTGLECGIKFTGNIQIEQGDELLAYKKETRTRVLE